MTIPLKIRIESTLGEAVVGKLPLFGKISTVSGREFFLKTGPPGEVFRCEFEGLRTLAATRTVAVARAVAIDSDYILTEWISPVRPDPGFFVRFAGELARLHKVTADKYGFHQDNFIGTTPQVNRASGAAAKEWPVFFFEYRLLIQYRLAERRNRVTPALKEGFRRLERNIPMLLKGAEEPPALLHGDLWGGNFLCGPGKVPYLIDPAVYFGHREADLAMTRLFGGFPPVFYEAYDREYPLKPDWERREGLYRLYHILNHLNMFGNSYLAEAEFLVNRYARNEG